MCAIWVLRWRYFCIGGPLIRKTLLNDSNGWTVVSAGRRYQGGVIMHHFYQFHHIIFSIFQFRISGLPILGNYGHQNHTHHLVLVARRYQWNSKTSCCSLTFYRRIAWLYRRIRSSWACFIVFYRRIDPSYRRAVYAPPFTPLCRHSRLREHSAAPLLARTDAINLL